MTVYRSIQRHAKKSVIGQAKKSATIDDCSADDTEKEIQRYLDIPYIHYYKNEKNLGAATSRNKDVKYAIGKYVAFLDSDDWWASGKLKKQLKKMQEEQGCNVRVPDGT